MHANGAAISYYINKDTVLGVKYYQMLVTYVRSEAQQFPHNIVFPQDEAPPHIRRAIRSLLD